jgi:hypothetical protein
VVAPTPSRLSMATMSAVAGADFLQLVYDALQRSK